MADPEIDRTDRIVHGGRERAMEAARAEIAAAVEERFRDALRDARGLRRLWLRARVRREIARELRRRCPPGACYAVASPRP